MSENIQGNYDAAKALFEEGLKIFRRIRNWNFQLIITSELGHVARRSGKFEEAKKIYRETLRGWRNMGNRAAISNQIECFAFLALIDEEPQRAALLLGAAEALREKIQAPMTDYEQVEYKHAIAQLQTMLSEMEYKTLWTKGRATPLDEAIQFALDIDRTQA